MGASCFAFLASCCTFVLGIIFVALKVKDLGLLFEECGFLEPADCNLQWRTVFTLRPEILLDLWTPCILGFLGMAIHIKSLKFPYVDNYVKYSLFMILTALFANVGYVAQLGVIIASLSGIAAVLCIVARLTGDKGLRYLEIGK